MYILFKQQNKLGSIMKYFNINRSTYDIVFHFYMN